MRIWAHGSAACSSCRNFAAGLLRGSLIETLADEAGKRGYTEVYAGTKNLGRFLRTLGWTFQEMIGSDKESIGLFRWRPEPSGSDLNTEGSTR